MSHLNFMSFYNLGLGDPVAVSSVHGHGTGDLLDRVMELIPDEQEEDDDREEIKVAIIGKPNVGKSSLVNKISGQERCIVSTLRDNTRRIDTAVENQHGKFILIDSRIASSK